MLTYPELYILRHGQTEWNVQGRLQGWLESDLTELGRQQAEKQREIMASVDLAGFEIWSSPMRRTQDTARIVLGQGHEIHLDDRLKEIFIGDLQGLTLAEIAIIHPEMLQDRMPFEWNFHSPNGEDYQAFSGRLQTWLKERNAPNVVVTHGVASRVLRGLVLGLDIAGMQALPDQQGVVYHIQNGVHRVLVEN
jgi:broad specificity phosphatase PhoE